jgi:hypothetical protein
MKPLVQSALEYIADNLQEIILLPIDMSCMNSVLVRQLASIVDVAILETLNDRKDKLRSKLYMKKLEVTFEDEQNYLVRCVNCCGLLTKSQRNWQVCPNTRLFIDANGQAKRQHVIDLDWDLNKFLLFLRQKKIDWNVLYWKLIACALDYKCSECGDRFAGNKLNQCAYHTNVPLNGLEPNEVYFSCCN